MSARGPAVRDGSDGGAATAAWVALHRGTNGAPEWAVALPGGLTAGRFVRRENRFRAAVEVGGQEVAAHVPNPGRMHELFVPGVPVLLAPMGGIHRVTAFDLVLVDIGPRWVSMDARLPVRLFRRAVEAGRLGAFGVPDRLEPEVPCGASRLDFRLFGDGGPTWVEVKSCTLVEDGVALFPDAPTTRGTRHMQELARRARRGERACAVFVVQRDDAESLRPFAAADPRFAVAVSEAATAGVVLVAVRCGVNHRAVWIADEIPVQLDESVGRP